LDRHVLVFLAACAGLIQTIVAISVVMYFSGLALGQMHACDAVLHVDSFLKTIKAPDSKIYKNFPSGLAL